MAFDDVTSRDLLLYGIALLLLLELAVQASDIEGSLIMSLISDEELQFFTEDDFSENFAVGGFAMDHSGEEPSPIVSNS